MNTDHVCLPKALLRGSVLSIVDTERPVIETFTDGKTVMPFAFLAGVPIPYNIFMLFMSLRFAPKCSQSMLLSRYENGEFCLPVEDHLKLTNLWCLCELPPAIKAMVGGEMRPWTANHIIRGLVTDLYIKHIVADDDSSKISFQRLIRRIDEDYVSSLIDPVRL